jgi:hypothetical protein
MTTTREAAMETMQTTGPRTARLRDVIMKDPTADSL